MICFSQHKQTSPFLPQLLISQTIKQNTKNTKTKKQKTLYTHFAFTGLTRLLNKAGLPEERRLAKTELFRETTKNDHLIVGRKVEKLRQVKSKARHLSPARHAANTVLTKTGLAKKRL